MVDSPAEVMDSQWTALWLVDAALRWDCTPWGPIGVPRSDAVGPGLHSTLIGGCPQPPKGGLWRHTVY